MVVTPHPLNNQPEEMIRGVARECLAAIMGGLVEPAPEERRGS